MMARSVPLIAFFLIAFVLLLLAPWWTLPIAAFAYGISKARLSPGLLFWPGLAVGALVYLIGALWYGGGDGVLPEMLGQLFDLGSAAGLYLVTVLIGGFLGGVFAMLGGYTRVLVTPARQSVAGSR